MSLTSVSESTSASTASFDSAGSAGSPMSHTSHTPNASTAAAFVSELPEDIFLLLIEYLDLPSIFHFAQTCRRIQKIFSTFTAYLATVRVAAKNIPLPDPFLINAPIDYPLLKDRLAKCGRFHNAWKTKTRDPDPLAMDTSGPSDSSSVTHPAVHESHSNPPDLSDPSNSGSGSNRSNRSDSISTSIIRRFDIPEKVCMVRILPGGQYVVVIDFHENAQFYEVATGEQVGRQSFSDITDSEVIYSIDFTVHSKTTVVWGLLTSGNMLHGNDNGSQAKLCIRAILIHFPEHDQKDRALRFEAALAHPALGTPEMLSISGSYIASYTYRSDDRSPTLTVWNWEQKVHATYPVPWNPTPWADYAGHPSLHATPKAVFLIGGQLGFHRLHADGQEPEDWPYQKAVTVSSTQEDANSLSYSSQGRCSKPWWGISSRPWHRLVTSPSRADSAEDARTLKVISFEVPNHPDDTEARRSYIDLGRHRIVPGQESSPQLYHISRFGSKAIWLCQRSQDTPANQANVTTGDADVNRGADGRTDSNISIQSVALPTFEQQMEGVLPGPVKRIDLGSQVNMNRLRAFDMDETAPLFAVAEDEILWLIEISEDS